MIIKIKDLISKGVFVPGKTTSGTITIGQEAMAFEAIFDKYRQLKLIYRFNGYDGRTHNINETIWIHSRRSNLGKGEILFFQCPRCFRLCRSLLNVNYSVYFKCRKCYSTLPYPTQTSSKMSRSNSQFFNVKRKLENLCEMRNTETYKGKKTRRARRIEILENKLQNYDFLRFSPDSFPLNLRRIIFKK